MMNKKKDSILCSARFLMVLSLALVFGNVACGVRKKGTMQTQDQTLKASQENGDVLIMVERMPNFPGGIDAMIKYIGDNLRYPVEAQRVGAEGRVGIRFVVDVTGKIVDADLMHENISFPNQQDYIVWTSTDKTGKQQTNITKLSDVKKQMIDEAKRVILTMPAWEPGMQDGKNVAVYFTIPISFRLR